MNAVAPLTLYCDCGGSGVIPAATRHLIDQILTQSRKNLVAVEDLCGLAARRDPLLLNLARRRPLRIAACHPRAVRNLLHYAGIDPNEADIDYLNLRVLPPNVAIRQLVPEADNHDQTTAVSSRSDHILALDHDQNEPPWFPVLDQDRCRHCGKCLDFCLFEVYATAEDGRVTVQNPQNCKLNCPACARVCPAAAIIFPKYKMDSIIAGQDVDEAAWREENNNDDLASLAHGDVYSILRNRSKGTGLLRRKEQAEAERRACLAKGDAPEACACDCNGNCSHETSATEGANHPPCSCACSCSAPTTSDKIDADAAAETAPDPCSLAAPDLEITAGEPTK